MKRRGCGTIVCWGSKMRKRIAFVLLVCAVLALLCSCAVKKESASDSAAAQPATGRIYGKVALAGAADCSDVIVSVTGGGWSYTTTADSEGNYSLEVDPASFHEIDFDCMCWSRTYELEDPVVVAAGAEVRMPDYNLSPDHFYELEEATSEYARYVCVECGEEKVFELGRNTTYMELSTEPRYMNEFVAACFIPHTDASLFD